MMQKLSKMVFIGLLLTSLKAINASNVMSEEQANASIKMIEPDSLLTSERDSSLSVNPPFDSSLSTMSFDSSLQSAPMGSAFKGSLSDSTRIAAPEEAIQEKPLDSNLAQFPGHFPNWGNPITILKKDKKTYTYYQYWIEGDFLYNSKTNRIPFSDIDKIWISFNDKSHHTSLKKISAFMLGFIGGMLMPPYKSCKTYLDEPEKCKELF